MLKQRGRIRRSRGAGAVTRARADAGIGGAETNEKRLPPPGARRLGASPIAR